jgi:ABC-type sugar transport system permease subunit
MKVFEQNYFTAAAAAAIIIIIIIIITIIIMGYKRIERFWQTGLI